MATDISWVFDKKEPEISKDHLRAYLKFRHTFHQSIDMAQYEVALSVEKMVLELYQFHALSAFSTLVDFIRLEDFLPTNVKNHVDYSLQKCRVKEMEEPKTFRCTVQYGWTKISTEFYLEEPERD